MVKPGFRAPWAPSGRLRKPLAIARSTARSKAAMAVMISAGLLFAGTGVPVVVEEVAQAQTQLPCDIYAAAGNTCEAAYSMTRALYAAYSGNLYQIQRASDGNTLNIGVTSAGGYANSGAQQSFCAGTTCTITMLYDQSGNGNNLPISDGGYWAGPGPNGADVGANANALPLSLAGHLVYGIHSRGGTGYRTPENINANNVPTGSKGIGIYMVTSSNYYNGQCSGGSYGELQVQNSGQYVTAIAEGSSSATAQGVPDIVQEPSSSSTSAQWKPEQQSDGSWQFVNQASGLCLDVCGGGSNQGQQLDQWPCKNSAGTNQDFRA